MHRRLPSAHPQEHRRFPGAGSLEVFDGRARTRSLATRLSFFLCACNLRLARSSRHFKPLAILVFCMQWSHHSVARVRSTGSPPPSAASPSTSLWWAKRAMRWERAKGAICTALVVRNSTAGLGCRRRAAGLRSGCLSLPFQPGHDLGGGHHWHKRTSTSGKRFELRSKVGPRAPFAVHGEGLHRRDARGPESVQVRNLHLRQRLRPRAAGLPGRVIVAEESSSWRWRSRARLFAWRRAVLVVLVVRPWGHG